MKKVLKKLGDCFYDMAFIVNDYHKRLTKEKAKAEKPRTQTKVGSYFHYWQEHVDKAMGYLSMKDHHRVAQTFMDIVECDLYTYDEDGKTTLKMEVDEDISTLVNMLVTVYAMEEVVFDIMLDLQNAFRYYNNKVKTSKTK